VTQYTAVIEPCPPQTPNEEVSAKVAAMLGKLPGIERRLREAKRVFVKLNIGIKPYPIYRDRPMDCVDWSVFAGLASFLRERTDAEVLVGDGCDGISVADAARERGHTAIIEESGFQLIDLHQPPYARFAVAHPTMFRWYELSSVLQDVDLFVSVAKMKSHQLTGVTLTLKNLFGLPPGPVYGSPRGALHSAIRLPGILADLTGLFKPEICLIDGIIGQNYAPWQYQGGDPVTSSILIAGDNPVATDAVGARFMGVDPEAPRGTLPFLLADNHIQLAAELGLGSNQSADIDLIGEMPSDRKPYSVPGGAEPETFFRAEQGRREACRQAQQYFDDRDRHVRDYLGEMIVLGNDRVLLHAPIGEFSIQDFFAALGAEGLRLEEVFCKLVQEEEAELREPYAL
jgi:uncharacterized protein (DUF362 family)